MATPTPTGNDVPVNSTTPNRQEAAGVALFADGSYLVHWEGIVGNGWNIYGKIYNADGTVKVPEFTASAALVSHQWASAAAVLSNGDFVIGYWNRFGEGDSHFQRFSVSGNSVTKLGGETRINTTTGGDQTNPSIEALQNGSFLATWDDGSSNSGDIKGQRFDVSGNTIGGEFTISSTTANRQAGARTAAFSDGGWVTTWDSFNGSNYDVMARIYDSSGNPIASEFAVASGAGNQGPRSVAVLNGGDFVVAWSTDHSGNNDIYFQRYSSGGTAVGGPTQVTTSGDGEYTAHVAAINDGGFVVGWQTLSNSQWDVFAQRFTSAGVADGSAFQLNSTSTGNQNLSGYPGTENLVQLPDGTLVAVFTGNDLGPNSNDVFVRTFNGLPAAGPTISAGFNIELATSTVFEAFRNALPSGQTPLDVADALFAGTNRASLVTMTASTVNYSDNGDSGTGHFGATSGFPTGGAVFQPSNPNDFFAVRATGTITIPTAGAWTFGTFADDGTRIKIDGVALFTDNTIHGQVDKLATVNLTAGQHTVELVYFENDGGGAVELFAQAGTHNSFNSGFQLIGDTANGGLAVTTTYAINAMPAITSNGAGDTAVVSVDENGTAVTTVTATDADAGQAISYSITGGADAVKFDIDATTGALTFKSAPNFEAPGSAAGSNVYDVTVRATDAGGATDDQAIAVTVTDVAENLNAPVVTAGQTFSIAENSANGVAVGTVAVTDADAPVNNPANTFSITGGNASGAFAINPTTGEISVADGVKLDFEASSSYSLTVQVSDGVNAPTSQTVTVNLSDVQGETLAASGGSVPQGGIGNDAFNLAATDLAPGISIAGGGGTDTLIITIGAGQTVDLTGVTITSVETAQLVVPNDWTTDFTLLSGLSTAGVGTVSWTQDGFGYAAVPAGGGNVTVTLTDTPGARSYDSRTATYTSAGVPVSLHVDWDDGSDTDQTYHGNGNRSVNTLIDTAGASTAYQQVVTTYDTGGVLASRTTTYDDGNTLAQTYQPGGARTDVKTDTAGSNPNYATESTTYNASGQITGSTVVLDDGNTHQFFYETTPGAVSRTVLTDTDGNERFGTRELTYDGTGTPVTFVTEYDAGQARGIREELEWHNGWVRRKTTTTDVDSGYTFDVVVTNYGVNGWLEDRTTTYDNGNTLVQTYDAVGARVDVVTDTADVHNYSASTTSYDAAGRATGASAIYDNGNTFSSTYDANGNPLLTTITDANGDDPYQRIETAFDGARQIDQIRNYWDHGSTWITAGAGNGGNNILLGGAGVDVLTGYAGNDTLTGGGGADVFWYSDNWGNDTITDFTPGTDQLDLRAVTGLDTFAQLSASQSGADTVLAFGGNSITLKNVAPAQLDPARDVLV